jgi:hypothetical protein
MFPYEPAALPQACRAGQSAVAPTTRGRHSESSLEAHTHNPAHCAPSYLDFHREHKRGEPKGRTKTRTETKNRNEKNSTAARISVGYSSTNFCSRLSAASHCFEIASR